MQYLPKIAELAESKINSLLENQITLVLAVGASIQLVFC